MSAQTAWLNAVSDNIANVSTTGYKQAMVEFSSLVLNSGLTSDYQSGSVMINPQIQIDGQGTLNATSSTTDLAIQGNGYFIVEGPNNQPVLTRVGSFTKDAAGDLVNAAGYTLLGYPAGSSGVANSFLGLVPINLNSIALQTTPTTAGKLYVNLPSNAAVVAPANLPSNAWNTTNATPTAKTSLVTYDNLGNQVTLDVYMTNEGGNKWDVAIFNAANATNGGFPYTVAPLTTGTLTFNPATGALAATSPTSFKVAIPNGSTMTLDMSQTTQLATSYTVLAASVNGNAPSQVSGVNIAADGTVSVTYQNGATIPTFTIPLANVQSPDKMSVITGNAYVPGLEFRGCADRHSHIRRPRFGPFQHSGSFYRRSCH